MISPPSTGRVQLRPWKINDAEWYVNVRDELIFHWTTEKRDLTVAEARAAIQSVNANPLVHSFAILEPGSEEMQGNITLVMEPENMKRGEVMYWLAPAGRGQGLATRALATLCQWAFETLYLETIVLKTSTRNLPSQRVAERAGFQKSQTNDPEHVWFVLSKSKR